MLPFVRIGPFLLQVPGLVLLAGFWIATVLIEKEALRLKLDADAVLKVATYAPLAGLLGARLFYAALHAGAYLQSPLGLLSLDTSTLDPVGGVVCGLITAYLLGSNFRLPLRTTLDALVPGLAIFMIAIGAAHALSGGAYGAPADLPWSIQLWGARRHPSQIYEILAAAIVFLIWMRRPDEQPGFEFLRWLILQTAALVFLQAFRGDSAIWPGGFRAAQVVGLMVLVSALYLVHAWRPARTPA